MSFADIFDPALVQPIDFPIKVGPTAPPSPSIGTAWLDTSGGKNQLKVWAVPGIWLLAAGAGIGLPPAPHGDMFLKSDINAPYNPVWSDLAEGGTF